MTEPENFVSIVSVLNRPFSRGTVHLASPDSKALPVFDPAFFSHPLDLELHARHVRWLETLAWTEPLASLLKADGRRLQNSSPDVPRDCEGIGSRQDCLPLPCRWYRSHVAA